jgi:hypothetical protein
MILKMKTSLYKKAGIIIATGLTLMFGSCLKDDKYVDFAGVGTTIELPLAAYSPSTIGTGVYKLQLQSYIASTTPADLPVVVNVASPKPLTTDLVVTLGVDAAAFATYNTAAGNKYVLLPAAAYTLTDPKTTIPANTRLGTVTFKINTSVVDKTVKNYVLPVSITDASGQQISNYKTIFYNIQVK